VKELEEMEQVQKQEEKKAYTTPKLTTHGDVESLTQIVPIDGSGPGDWVPVT
jgi:hypothetical protein